MAFLLINNDGSLKEVSLKLRQKASLIALLWFASSTIFLITTFANILDTSFSDALDMTSLQSFVSQVSVGRYLFIQTLAAFLVGYFLLRVRRVIPVITLLQNPDLINS